MFMNLLRAACVLLQSEVILDRREKRADAPPSLNAPFEGDAEESARHNNMTATLLFVAAAAACLRTLKSTQREKKHTRLF